MHRSLHFLFGQRLPRCDHRINKYFDYYVLQYMESGEIDLCVGDKSHRLKGRCFWSSYPGPLIRFHPVAGTKRWFHRYLAFRGKAVDSWINASLFPIAPQIPAPTSNYGARFDELLSLAIDTDPWKRARAALLLETILTELAEQRARPNTTPPWLERTLAALADPRIHPDYDALARDAAMPPRTFRRNFFRATGMSPRGYLISRRISEAMRLLGATEMSIKSIAEHLGYSDVFFFSRQFTRFAGVSPAAYRRSREW